MTSIPNNSPNSLQPPYTPPPAFNPHVVLPPPYNDPNAERQPSLFSPQPDNLNPISSKFFQAHATKRNHAYSREQIDEAKAVIVKYFEHINSQLSKTQAQTLSSALQDFHSIMYYSKTIDDFKSKIQIFKNKLFFDLRFLCDQEKLLGINKESDAETNTRLNNNVKNMMNMFFMVDIHTDNMHSKSHRDYFYTRNPRTLNKIQKILTPDGKSNTINKESYTAIKFAPPELSLENLNSFSMIVAYDNEPLSFKDFQTLTQENPILFSSTNLVTLYDEQGLKKQIKGNGFIHIGTYDSNDDPKGYGVREYDNGNGNKKVIEGIFRTPGLFHSPILPTTGDIKYQAADPNKSYTYSGEINKLGEAHGNGVRVNNDVEFKGVFTNGILALTNCKIHFPDGNEYTGPINAQLQMHGAGKIKLSNGNTFRGIFTNGIPTSGTIISSNSNYTGDVNAQFQMHGQGKIKLARGISFEGTFTNNAPASGTLRKKDENYVIVHTGTVDANYSPVTGNHTIIFRVSSDSWEGQLTNGVANGNGGVYAFWDDYYGCYYKYNVTYNNEYPYACNHDYLRKNIKRIF